jgi:cobalt/nickel transport system permease protein
MSSINNALYNLRQMDDLAAQNTPIHRIHPLAKIIVTMVFLVTVVSFSKYSISGLLGLVIYPFVIMSMAELPVKIMLKRLLVLEPFVLGIGLFSPFFDPNTLVFGEFAISAGWVTLLSILIKGSLTISAGLLLIATTGIDRVAEGLRMLRVPRILVLQILLTYRYVLVLIEELSRMTRAYFLRAPAERGIRRNVWGSFAGQLLLRTYDRAQRIYVSMSLRGFQGEYHVGKKTPMKSRDYQYLVGWCLFFVLCRWIPLANLIAYGLKGVLGV